MDILIRSARLSDLATLKTFEQGIIEAERPFDVTLKADPIRYYDIGQMISSERSEVAVALVGGELVGSGYVQKRPSLTHVQSDFHAFIGFLYVAPEYRGQGINNSVLDHLFAWAKANQLPDVHLKVYPDNQPAIRAYEKAGFTPHMLEMRLDLDE